MTDEDCFCGGDREGFKYHSPRGCAATSQAFSMVDGYRGQDWWMDDE